MALTDEQRRVARSFDRVADRRRLRPLIRKALFEAGLVEANLGNPPGGDLDSVGSLQERSHYGSRARRMDPTKAAERFVNEAEALVKQGFKGSAGQLAQAVQRSAFPDRYDQRGSDAVGVIRKYGGYGSDGQPAGADTGKASPVADVASIAAAAALTPSTPPAGTVPTLSSLIDARQRMSRSTAPDFGALSSPVQPVASLTPDMAIAAEAVDPAVAAPPQPRGLSRAVRSRQDPWEAAMTAGATVSDAIRPAGTLTSAGNISDHTGKPGSGTMARDFTGDLPKIAKAIARSLGIKNYKGGLVNVNKGKYRYQLIWKAEGHYDHVHLGRHPL